LWRDPASRAKTPITELYAKLTVASGVFLVVLKVPYLDYAILMPPEYWVDNTYFLVGRYFLNTWMRGRSFFSSGPRPWFDYHVYNQALQHRFGLSYPEVPRSHPPLWYCSSCRSG
jgi:hypothetical protein